jgi:tetratricopeptide (TPR) repeat protein
VRSSYPDRSAVEFQLARAEYQAGHVTESEKTLLDAVNANYATSDGYVLLCTLLSADGSDIRALQIATQATQRFPESSEVLSVKGSVEVKLQYYTDAVASYEKAAKLKDSAAARRGMATAQWKAGLHERAISTFEQAVRQFPRDAGTYQVYGTLLLEDEAPENKRRGVDLLKRALALNDSAVEPRYQLANLELADGNSEQARAYLERAIQLDPNDSRLHFVLSRVYRRLGRETDAGRETEMYQKLNAAKQAGSQNDTAGGTRP